MNALKKKIEATENEDMKQRDSDFDVLQKRFQNVRKEQETAHNVERAKLEKQLTKQ